MDQAQFWQNAPEDTASAPAPAAQDQQPNGADYGAPGAAVEPGNTPQETIQQQPGESDVSFEERLRQAEERAQQLEQQNQQFQETFTKVRSWAEQQAMQQQQQARAQQVSQREEEIYKRAETMPASEAWRYIQEENRKLREEQAREFQQNEQQIKRALGTPLYIDNLAQQYGLPPEAKQELMDLGDPDLAARMAPRVKARYDQFSQLQQQINQLSRTEQAQRMQANGVGMGGGTTPPGGNVSLPDDPDDRALAILAQLDAGTYQPSDPLRGAHGYGYRRIEGSTE